MDSIGIIGGAGPTAGAYLFQKIVAICQQKYGCERDSDFPRIILLSYPFSDMLGDQVNKHLINIQLQEAIDCLISNKITVGAIACNTLHGFLPPKIDGLKLVHIIEVTKEYLETNNWKNPLILCSSTAAKNQLHAKYFTCHYPDLFTQKIIDDLIDAVTAGCCLEKASSKLSSLIGEDQVAVLGCTELSVIHESKPLSHSKICNPNHLLAEEICKLAFQINV